MKLIEKKNQLRRDFTGVYECENCGNVKEYRGCYDDRNFHDNVMPKRKCDKCEKCSEDLNVPIVRVATKYSYYEIVQEV